MNPILLSVSIEGEKTTKKIGNEQMDKSGEKGEGLENRVLRMTYYHKTMF